MGVPWGEKAIPAESPLCACRNFSSCSRPHWGELPTPHCLCTEPGFGVRRKGSPLPQPTIYNTTPGQGFNSAIFPHLPCCFSIRLVSTSQSPCADSSTGHYSPRRRSLATSPFWVPECYRRLSRAERGAEPGRESGIPAFGMDLAEEIPGERGAVRRECGVVGGTAGSVPQRKGSLKQGWAFAVPSGARGRRHAQQLALCHRRRANRAGPSIHPSW